jgi:gliding motility-associated-like protein
MRPILSLIIALSFFLPINSFAQTPVWGFKIGGAGLDEGHYCKVAPNGNVCVVGKFSNTVDLDPGVGVYNITSNGQTDAFVACYTPTGGFLWGFGVGGTSYDGAWTIAFDASSNIIVTGFFQGGADFDPGAGAAIIPYAGGTGLTYEGDGFVAKYSSTGVYQWAKGLGGSTVYDITQAVGTDALNNVYVGGVFSGSMVVSGTITLTGNTNYLIKYDPAGNVIWARNFGSVADGFTRAMEVRGASLYITGYFRATSNFNPWGTPAIVTAVNVYDAFVAKYDTAGNFVFVQQISGPGNDDEFWNLTLDASENIYVSGITNSSAVTFNMASPGTSTVTSPGGGGNRDILMAKYSSSGVYQWGRVLGSSGDDVGFGVDILGGNLYSIGYFSGTVDFDPSAAVASLTSAGLGDIYLAKYNLAGNYRCAYRTGNTTDDIGYGICHDLAGNMYTTGQFGGASTDFDPGTPTFPLTSSGGVDGYLVKYQFNAPTPITGSLTGDTVCPGQTAQLTVTVTSGLTGPYDISYTDGTTIYTATGVISGVPFTVAVAPAATTTYSIVSLTTTGLNPCAATSGAPLGTATIIVGAPPITITSTITNCYTDSFIANAGYTNYTWSFGDGGTSTLNPVTHTYSATGTYTVTVIGASSSGCSDTASLIITIPPIHTVKLGNDTTICGSAIITLAPWLTYPVGTTYTWSTGATTPTTTVNTSGTYTLGVKIGACTVYDTIVVTMLPGVNLNLGNDTTICGGDSVILRSIQPAGSFYLWSTGKTTDSIHVKTSGVYTLRVTNSSGCARYDTISITVLPPLLVNLGVDTSFCAGATLTLGSYVSYPPTATYLWSTTDITPTINVTTSGTYSLSVTIGPCTVTDSRAVTVNPNPVVNLGNDTTICGGDSVVLISTQPAGSTWAWSNGKTTDSIHVKTTGVYILDVTNSGCSKKDTIAITVLPVLTVNLGPDITVCSDATTTLSSSVTYPPAATYLWSTGATTSSITVTTSGTYSLTVTLGSCSATDAITVTVRPSPVVNLGNDTTFCIGDSIILSSVQPAGSTWAWSTGSTLDSIHVKTTGSYSLTVTNSFGCSKTDVIEVIVSTGVTVDLGPDSLSCNGAAVTLQSAFTYPGSATYLWSTGSIAPALTVTTSGQYWLRVIDGGCPGFDTVNISIIYDTMTFYNFDTTICAGAAIQGAASGNPGLSFMWIPTVGVDFPFTNNPTITPDTSTTYTVITSMGGCPPKSNSFRINVQPNPTVSLGGNRVVCRHDTLHIAAFVSPTWFTGYTYTWSPGTAFDDSLAAAVAYTGDTTVKVKVVVSTSKGCASADSAMVTVYPADTLDPMPAVSVCPRKTVQLSPTTKGGASTYKWASSMYLASDTASLQIIKPITSITYTVISTNTYGCSDTGAVDVTVHPGATIFLGDSVTIYPGESFQISPQTNCTYFTWSPATGLSNRYISNPVATPEANTRYVVHAMNEYGCEVEDTLHVYVSTESILGLPNAFAPGSGPNNLFRIYKRGLATLNYFRIFNRWGNLVYESRDIDAGWDGTYKGTLQPFGVYVYEIEAVTSTGKLFRKAGNVTLIK